jgi:hypothetical protein
MHSEVSLRLTSESLSRLSRVAAVHARDARLCAVTIGDSEAEGGTFFSG